MSTISQLNLPPTSVERLRTATQPAADSLRSPSRWRELVTKARNRLGLSQKEMAGGLGITEQQFSDQLKGRENYHLSFWRMLELGPEFWAEMLDLIADFYGLPARGASPQDIEDMRIGRAFRELQQQALRGQR